MNRDANFLLLNSYIVRDVAAFLKAGGPAFIGPFSPKKSGGAKSTFYLILAKKWGSQATRYPFGMV